MQNVKITVDGETLRIEVDLTKCVKLTRSYRNMLIGSTLGSINLSDKNGIRREKLNLSVWRAASEDERLGFRY